MYEDAFKELLIKILRHKKREIVQQIIKQMLMKALTNTNMKAGNQKKNVHIITDSLKKNLGRTNPCYPFYPCYPKHTHIIIIT